MNKDRTYYIIFPELMEVVKGSFKLAMSCVCQLKLNVIIVNESLEVIATNYNTRDDVITLNINDRLFYLDDGHSNWFVRK